MQLLVLGMHRSGTSALARMLSLLGCHTGTADEVLEPNEFNPEGYWERRDVVEADDWLLRATGASWDRPLMFEPAGLPDDVRETFRTRAAAIVGEMDARRPWFIKDPRLCLLLPEWLPLLAGPVCIHIHRHPLEVAASLQRRDDLPIPVGLALWELHVRRSLEASTGLPRLFVSHRELMKDPVAVAGRLLAGLEEAGVTRLTAAPADVVRAAISPDLHRHRVGVDESRAWQGVAALELFGEIEAGRVPAGPLSAASCRVLAARDTADRVAVEAARIETFLDRERLGRAFEASVAQVAELDRALRASREDADRSLAARDALRTELASARTLATRAQQQAAEALAAADAARRDADAWARQADEARRRAALAAEDLARIRLRLADTACQLAVTAASTRARRGPIASALRSLRSLRRTVRAGFGGRRAGGAPSEERRVSWTADETLIAGSDLFDATWYRRTCTTPIIDESSAVRHYLRIGGFAGLPASPRFDSRAYLVENLDVAAAGVNPLVHYLRHGRREGRPIRPVAALSRAA